MFSSGQCSDTSITSVDSGKWKFVISAIQYFKTIPRINKNLRPATLVGKNALLIRCCFQSSVQLVVPTADDAMPPAALRTIDLICLLSALSDKIQSAYDAPAHSSSLTGRNVTKTDMKRHLRDLYPHLFYLSASSSFVKCSPAVGAAAEPSYFAYTVW